MLVVQYLDDILFVGPRPDVQDMARRATAALEQAGYIISPKSDLEPTKLITWMGKRVNLNSACIEPSTPFVADVVSKWLLLALKPYHYKSLWRLLGKIVWLGRPTASVGSFLAGPWSWLNQGPFWSSRTPFAVVRSLLEAIAASFRGWEPHCVSPAPPVRIFSDAAPNPHFPGRYVVGLWSPRGPSVRRVPVWVDNQQAAELYGALAALDLVRRSPQPRVQLVLDNMGAIAQILWGRARSNLCPPSVLSTGFSGD